MSTSGSVDYSITAMDIITGAHRVCGVLSGNMLSAEMAQDAIKALNLLIKSWTAMDIGLWTQNEATLYHDAGDYSHSIGPTGDHCTLSGFETEVSTSAVTGASTIDVDAVTGVGDGYYIGIELDDDSLQWTTVNGAPSGTTVTLTAVLTDDVAEGNYVYCYETKTRRPMEIVEARRVSQLISEIPIALVSRLTYMQMPDKTSQGPVNQMYFDPKLTNANLKLWPAPSSAREFIRMTVKTQIEDFDDLVNNPDFPQEWFRALKFALAFDIAPEFGLYGNELAAIKALRDEAVTQVINWDNEHSSVMIVPGRGPR